VNVSSVETAPQSLPAPSLAASSSLTSSLTGSNPASELGAFLALFNGFVASGATTDTPAPLELPLPIESEPAKPPAGKDRNKGDKPKEKLPDSSAASLAQTGLDLSTLTLPVVVLPATPVVVLPTTNAATGSLVDVPAAPSTHQQSPAEVSPASSRSNAALLDAPVAFALRLTERTAFITPQRPANSPGDAKPAPPADNEQKNMAAPDLAPEAPTASESNIADCPSPAADKQMQNAPTIAPAPVKEFISIQRPQVRSDVVPRSLDLEAPPVRVPDPLSTSQTPALPVVQRASQPADIPKAPDAPANSLADVPASASADRLTTEGAPSEQNSVQSTHTPASERVVFPRPQQRSTQQDTSNGQQSGSKESKAPTTDRRDTSPQRNQGATPNNPINFDVHVRTAAEAAGPGRGASDSPQATKIAPDIETNPATSTQPTRQISLKLEGTDSQKVAIQLTERAGKVQVAVRTADGGLAKSLQGDLGDLVGRLENKGYKTEAWVPATVRHATSAVFEPGNTANSQGQSGNSGSGSGREPGEQKQNGSNQRQHPRWAAQLEESLDETGKEKQ
jgi:hypothetical protein